MNYQFKNSDNQLFGNYVFHQNFIFIFKNHFKEIL